MIREEFAIVELRALSHDIGSITDRLEKWKAKRQKSLEESKENKPRIGVLVEPVPLLDRDLLFIKARFDAVITYLIDGGNNGS